MKTLFREFKEFAVKGNVIDLAVGVIIGVAFGKIVTSLVNDILMPPLGMLLGKVEFNALYVPLDGKEYASLDAAREADAPLLAYGAFLQNLLDFLIVAFAVFLLVRQLNRMKSKPQGPPPTPVTKECPHCISVIPLKASRCAYCTQLVS